MKYFSPSSLCNLYQCHPRGVCCKFERDVILKLWDCLAIPKRKALRGQKSCDCSCICVTLPRKDEFMVLMRPGSSKRPLSRL